MVQLGDLHIGKAETAKPPALDSGEAFFLWDQLISRYDIIEQTQIYLNFAHDPDFKYILKKGLEETLEKQVDDLEKEMNIFKLPLPNRPPKSVRVTANSGIMDDQMMFRQLFTGIQSFLESHIRTIRAITTNDPLRHKFIKFAKEELDIFESLCKFGKLKGWLLIPPMKTMVQ